MSNCIWKIQNNRIKGFSLEYSPIEMLVVSRALNSLKDDPNACDEDKEIAARLHREYMDAAKRKEQIMGKIYLISLVYEYYDIEEDYVTTYNLPIVTVRGQKEAELMLRDYQNALPVELETIFSYQISAMPAV